MSKRTLTRGQLTVTALYDGKDGAPGPTGPQGPQGEQGDTGDDGEDGVGVLVEQPIVLQTDQTGVVPASELQDKVAKVRVWRGSANVSGQCASIAIDSTQGCSATASKTSDASGMYIKVQLTAVATTQTEAGAVSACGGYATLSFKLAGRTHRTQVPFEVSVARYVGGVKATALSLQSQYTELKNDLSSSSPSVLASYTTAIQQTARRLSIEASQGAVGRRNLLSGTQFLRQSGYWQGNDSYQPRISVAQGFGGTNAVKVVGEDGHSQGLNFLFVPLANGRTYTVSVLVKKVTELGVSGRLMVYVLQRNANKEKIEGTDLFFTIDVSNTSMGEWYQFAHTFSVHQDTRYIDLVFLISSTTGTVYFCRPMLEEGDTYTGWTPSKQDYDYVGGNMLDDTMTLSPSSQQSNLEIHESIAGGTYEGAYAVAYGKADDSNANMDDFLQFSGENIRQLNFVKGKDYVLSFLAKGTGQLNTYMYKNGHQNVFAENMDGDGWNTTTDGCTYTQLTWEWKRYWVHWRIEDYTGDGDEVLPTQVLFRAITGCEAYVAQPKLEEGATPTAYTEKKTDLIDKATAKAAGIEITSGGVTLYGERISVKNTLSSGLVLTNALFEDGYINARFILAQMLQTEGLSGRKITIGNGMMNVYGARGVANIRFGLNSAGQAVLSYYDDNGNFLYDLGPSGIATLDKTNGSITSQAYYEAGSVGLTSPIGENVELTYKSGTRSWYTATQHNDSILFGGGGTWNKTVIIYTYTAPRVNNKVVADPANGLTTQQLAAAADGKAFTSRTMVVNGALTNFALGTYIKVGAKPSDLSKRIPALSKGDMAVMPSQSFVLYNISSLGFQIDTVYSRSTETFIGTLDIGIID